IVDNLTTGLEQRLNGLRKSLEFIRGDLADSRVSDDAVKGVDFVLHQAAIPSVQRSVADPLSTNRANVTATLNLLESCRKAAVRRMVFAASSSAYGDTEVLPKVEEMPPDPLSPYALQKLVGERYCQLYYRLYGLETVSLRYFNVFGPSQDPHSEYSAVIPKFIAAMQAKKSVTVYGDGEQSRDFTYVDNVVDANLKALRAPQAAGRVCNIGCGERITLNTLIRSLEEIIGIKADVIYAAAKPGDVRHSLADISLAKQLFGYDPKVGVEEGLRRTVAAFAPDAAGRGD
ncbi:MAG TPA: NAD-dependent epimerase/dehydratase family protein, partial [Candidatus Limnocylindria bacterium]|nr:NAD-dependent epimerase/dehydratase family protein [Candidatus Limnocylindria bacterium]